MNIKAALLVLGVTVLSVAASVLTAGCSKSSDKESKPVSERDRGRAVYVANCVACHNSDPAKEGPIGPAIKGSPRELIEARVLRASYPPNYKPKRQTKIMPQFPFLAQEIPYLAAYLAPESAQQNQTQNVKHAG